MAEASSISLGGAVVTHLAAKQSREGKNVFTGIVVESTFTSISDIKFEELTADHGVFLRDCLIVS